MAVAVPNSDLRLQHAAMNKTAALAYGLVSYAFFLVSFLYAIGFVGNFAVPKSIDSGPLTSPGAAVVTNLILLSLFAVQHSVMARQWFKAWWTRIVPRPIERSTFVLMASLLLLLIFWQWRPMAGVVWSIENEVVRAAVWAVFALGWVLVLVATFVIDHFDLFGLRQVHLYAQGKRYTPPHFKASWLYSYVRHPLLLGFMIAFWATPQMTVGHLLFAGVTTAYMFVAIQLEERDLVRFHGEAYEIYRREVRMLLPWRVKRKS